MFVSSLIRSKRKRQKDARTDYIHLPTTTMQSIYNSNGRRQQHALTQHWGKNKTVHGTSRLFSNNERAKFKKQKQNLKIIIRFFFFFFFLEFLALKMIIVFCQSTLGPNSTLLFFAGPVEHNNNTDNNRFVFLLYFDENSKLLSVFRSNFVFSQRHTQHALLKR